MVVDNFCIDCSSNKGIVEVFMFESDLMSCYLYDWSGKGWL